MSSGCPFVQGPACWDCSGSCWDREDAQEPGPPECDGSDTCPAPWHIHGCLEDNGGCTEPHVHVIAAETPRQKDPK
jgi:hypothetical protein